jgi:hypothetical protein
MSMIGLAASPGTEVLPMCSIAGARSLSATCNSLDSMRNRVLHDASCGTTTIPSHFTPDSVEESCLVNEAVASNIRHLLLLSPAESRRG